MQCAVYDVQGFVLGTNIYSARHGLDSCALCCMFTMFLIVYSCNIAFVAT